MRERTQTPTNYAALERMTLWACKKNAPWIPPLLEKFHSINNPDNIFQHSIMTAYLAVRAAIHLGLSKEKQAILFKAGLTHDVGKVAVPRPINEKPGPLTPEEILIESKHVPIGVYFVKDHDNADADRMQVAEVVKAHHDTDFPKKCEVGDDPELILAKTILAASDEVDAMRRIRCYRDEPIPEETILALKGPLFGEELVQFLLDTRRSVIFEPVVKPVVRPEVVYKPPELPHYDVIFMPVRSGAAALE